MRDRRLRELPRSTRGRYPIVGWLLPLIAVLAFASLPLQMSAAAERSLSDPAHWAALTEPSQAAASGFSLSILEPLGAAKSSPDASAQALPSLGWTRVALGLVRKYQQNPLRASRALALLHAAMHDAYGLVARDGGPPAAADIALHRAAGIMLGYLYSGETPGRYEAMSLFRIAAGSTGHEVSATEVAHALRAGEIAARATIARASSDGAARIWPVRNRPADRPGSWRPTPPIFAFDPMEPLAGEWRTWVLRDGAQLQPPPPVEFDSDAYWAEVTEVKSVADALTDEQKALADNWNLEKGSITPAGVWNLEAEKLALERGLSAAETVRLFAGLNVAMADAFIACWHAKFVWWTQRPVTVIRERLDAQFLPYLITPNFPSYVSGHATVSGAASAVLAAAFPDKRDALLARAAQAAQSRLYGGIHFRSDNGQGLALGQRIGAAVVERLELTPR
jgi:hypothetical protein